MSTKKNELLAAQSVALEKAIAVTKEQVSAAVKISEDKFSSHALDYQIQLTAAVIEALSTNYLAEVTRASSKK